MQRFILRGIIIPLVFLLLSLFVTSYADAEVDPSSHWGQYISHHTQGEVSKKATLRVVFTRDMVDAMNIGKAVEGVKIKPAAAVDIHFESPRELVVVPQSSFNTEKTYTITISANKFDNIPDELDKFKFQVTIMSQNFEIWLDDITPATTPKKTVSQRGSLITRDVETSLVEMLLSAKLDGRNVSLKWNHNPDGKHHDFEVRDIERYDSKSRELEFYWNGFMLGIENEGKRHVKIPSISDFKVMEVVARIEDSQYIQAIFSDPLDTTQNLNGLITLSEGDATMRIEDNIIKIFPQSIRPGRVDVTIHPGIQGGKGERILSQSVHSVFFLSEKPKVRFVGKGVVMPDNKYLTVPFEAINVDSVQVTAFKIYEDNLGQFFQANKYDGRHELGRVGRYLWQKTIPLSDMVPDTWGRKSLDVTKLLQDSPGSLFRLTLSVNRNNSIYNCSSDDSLTPAPPTFRMANNEDLHVKESSGWDGIESYYHRNEWRDRNDPCKDAYFKLSNETKSSRNLLASNIGIIAKRGKEKTVRIITTNLKSAKPLAKVKVILYNFQNQAIGSIVTDNNGFAELKVDGTPFYLTASKGSQRGYLKMSSGLALPTSHFDVGGHEVKQGIKGHIYAERGVWRPGDDIYLTFVLEDKNKLLPADYPVSIELYNPKGQLIKSLTNSKPVGGFYPFKLKTSEDDITGKWSAVAKLGGLSFVKKLMIETVVPNRLKLELDVGGEMIYQEDLPREMTLFGQWLHGATASELEADISVRLRSRPTDLGRYKDHIFDDPARSFSSDKKTIFEGKLDSSGRARFKGNIVADDASPGMLTAQFFSRIFEEGGAFSSSSFQVPFHPYRNYVGIKIPKGDKARGMLLTDTMHKVSIVSLDAHGKPVSLDRVQVKLYKIDWKWWWDKSSESLARYANARYNQGILQENISTNNGVGTWEFEVKYPQWGRYLIRACDQDGNHCTGKVFYMDWPGWAGRAKEEKGVGASALTLYTAKSKYSVGETATVVVPAATAGRALFTLENGSRVLSQKWIEVSGKETRVPVAITADMAPNIYASVMLIQPHAQKKNDLPIRLYGIVPVEVEAPNTVLHPVIETANEYAPQSKVNISVSEKNGRSMTYTLAIVDEGLLGLTNFKTPDLHKQFFRRESLGVKTWDLFDEVVGAYGGKLERLLALGGDEGLLDNDDKKKERRFPPVVRFLGPFELKRGQQKSHIVQLPLYVGAVRVMVVAGESGSYGSVAKSVPVRESLIIQSTLPRVLGPGEELLVPVSIFTSLDSIRNVSLSLNADNKYFSVLDGGKVNVTFNKKGEKIAFLRLKVKEKLGMASMKFYASSGKYEAREKVSIEVRSPNTRTVRIQRSVLEPGKTWNGQIQPHGLSGTNKAVLEVSSVPPFNLEKHLRFLIRYPHGCIEQTTSSVFPQLYLPGLVRLDPDKRGEIDKNITAGIERLRLFQLPDGGFSYWPNSGTASTWGTNYAGHFLMEAERLGYQVPGALRQSWVNHQRTMARAWTTGGKESALEQAYRLYTLVLAGSPELGAMNRLRESGSLTNSARWQLATAYQLVGLAPVAKDLVSGSSLKPDKYRTEGRTYGSELRDRSIILVALMAQKDYMRAKELFESIAQELASERWHSTQTTAYALLAMASFVSGNDMDGFSIDLKEGSEPLKSVSSSEPIYQHHFGNIAERGGGFKATNTGNKVVYLTLLTEGIPKAGQEIESSEDLHVSARFTNKDGKEIDPGAISQGSDAWAEITVRNLKDYKVENLALTQVIPSGWQIHNARLNEGIKVKDVDYQDIRDDRVLTYFSLNPGKEKTLKMVINASFLGHYYLPGWNVEAMYDASVNGRLRGRWIDVVK